MYFRNALTDTRPVGQLLAVLLAVALFLTPVMEALAQADIASIQLPEKVIVLDERVGETIDLAERNRYGLFLFARNFEAAVIVQHTDTTYVAYISETTDGEKGIRELPLTVAEITEIRNHISYLEGLSSAERERITALNEADRQSVPSQGGVANRRGHRAIIDATQQAKQLVREEWSSERWQEESRYDQGVTYRGAGMVVGCALGAAAGMLVGKGIQEREVARTEYHSGGEWGPGWSEDFYSYKHKHAPHVGALVGGVVGGVLGYIAGRKADKEYYILVPRHIRMEDVNAASFGNVVVGFALVGPIVGGIAGWALATPMTDREGTFDGTSALIGYLFGAILGTTASAGGVGRSKRKELWRNSLLTQRSYPAASLQVIPFDSDSFAFNLMSTPEGEPYFEYTVDLVRVRF